MKMITLIMMVMAVMIMMSLISDIWVKADNLSHPCTPLMGRWWHDQDQDDHTDDGDDHIDSDDYDVFNIWVR